MRGVTVPVLAAWESSTRTTLVAGRKQAKDVAVTAATELYFDIRALPVEQGRPFPGQEVQAGVPVLVLGHERSEKHTSELQSQSNIVFRLLLEKKKIHTTLYR